MALENFIVKGLRPTGRELGRGAFGRVGEARIPGAVCAAKRIHDELLRTDSAEDVTSKFVKECELMSNLRHPHIVQFLGVCYVPESSDIPSLVMEKLDCDLHKLLETIADIPTSVKRSILSDIANGLVYLHGQNPSVIHRDLTARNVLLNSSLMAKIGDMGVAHIVNLSPGQLAATMSRGPRNIVYMAPEAMEDHPKYDTSLDVFSFGNLIIFTVTQVFPSLKGATYVEPKTQKLYPRSEIDRRIDSINLLVKELGDKNHRFILLAKQCLQNVPEARPSASDVVTSLASVVLVPYRSWDSNKMEMMRDILDGEAEGRRMKWGLVHGGLEGNQVESQGGRPEHKPLRQSTQGPVSQLGCSLSLHAPQALDKKGAVKSISWRKAKRMPKRLESAQSVVLNGNVYVGSERTILSYSIENDEWIELPKLPQREFSMAVLNDKLVLVGGLDVSGIFLQHILDTVTVWDPDTGAWTHPFPRMPAARYNATSTGYKGYLIIAGGREHMPEDSNLVTSQVEVPSLSTVEIFDSAASKWYSGDPLPFECHAVQSSVIGDTLYMIGGRNRFDFTKAVVCTSLPNLISKACQSSPISESNSVTKSYCWNVLSPSPYYASSIPFCCRNHGDDDSASNGDNGSDKASMPLIAVGGLSGLQLSMLGELDTTGLTKDINSYDHLTNRWIKVGELPEVCVGCSCSLLPSEDLFVAGGGLFRSALNSVYIGKFQM